MNDQNGQLEVPQSPGFSLRPSLQSRNHKVSLRHLLPHCDTMALSAAVNSPQLLPPEVMHSAAIRRFIYIQSPGKALNLSLALSSSLSPLPFRVFGPACTTISLRVMEFDGDMVSTISEVTVRGPTVRSRIYPHDPLSSNMFYS